MLLSYSLNKIRIKEMSVLQVDESFPRIEINKYWTAISEKAKIDFEEMNKL